MIVTLAMVGKFTASAAYAIIYLYSSELLPTSVRNTGMGICSMMARFGSMLAPKINDLVVIFLIIKLDWYCDLNFKELHLAYTAFHDLRY